MCAYDEIVCLNVFSLSLGGVRFKLPVTWLACFVVYVLLFFSQCHFQGKAFQINGDFLPGMFVYILLDVKVLF